MLPRSRSHCSAAHEHLGWVVATCLVLLAAPLSTQAASTEKRPVLASAEGDPLPSLTEQGGPIWIIQDRDPDHIGKAGAVPSDPTTLGAVDLMFESVNFDNNIVENGGFVFIPPDPIGAAGTDRVLAVVNTMIECRTRGGHFKWRESLADFFAPLAPQTFTFDPKVVWDHYENRFVVVTLEQVAGGGNLNPASRSRVLVAVSRNATPKTPTADDWYYHAIDAKTIYLVAGVMRDAWADYPGFEVDEEAVYITANMFGFSPSSFRGVNLWIVDKGLGSGGFYDGGAASHSVHNPYAGGGAATTTMPAEVHGAGGVGGPGSSLGTFLVSYSGLSDGLDEYVQVITVDDPLGVSGGPTFTQEFVQIANLEDFPPGGLLNAPQPDTAELINVNDRRALDAVWRDDRLWLTATIRPNSGPDMNQTTAIWWQLDTSAGPGATAPVDHGLIGGEDLAEGTFTYFPSVAVNALGDAMFGFAASAPTLYAGAYAAGREAGDPAGTVQATLTVHAGEDWYLRRFGGTRNRWGDYSGISVDPEDDEKFWVFNEFADQRGTPTNMGTQDGRWATAWARVKFLKEEGAGAVVEVFPGPSAAVLEQNEPNPFNPATRIRYRLPRASQVVVRVFNVRGQQVRTLIDGHQDAGEHSVVWNGRDAAGLRVPSGSYIYRIEAEGVTASKRMILLQ